MNHFTEVLATHALPLSLSSHPLEDKTDSSISDNLPSRPQLYALFKIVKASARVYCVQQQLCKGKDQESITFPHGHSSFPHDYKTHDHVCLL